MYYQFLSNSSSGFMYPKFSVLKFAAIAEVDIMLESGQTDEKLKIKEAEELVTKVINDILRPNPRDQHYGAKKEAVQRIQDVTERLMKIGLSNTRVGESIILSFHCRTIDDLQKVKDELSKEIVKTMIMKVYAAIGILSAERIDSLVSKWHKFSYDRCLKFFQGILSFLLYSYFLILHHSE